MKRELMNAVVSFAALSARLEKLQDDTVTTANKRDRLVTDLTAAMTHAEVGRLLGISEARVRQLSRIRET